MELTEDQFNNLQARKDISFITFTNHGFIHYTKNLILSLEKCNFPLPLKVYCIDQKSFDELQEWNKNITLENKSLDTIQNIVFTFKILKKKNIRKVTMISSIWHLNRIKKIIDYVSERKMDITYFGAKKILPKNIEEIKRIKLEINNIRILKDSLRNNPNKLFSE